MHARIRAWRRRQPSRILFIAVPKPGSLIVAAGLRSSVDFGVHMIELQR